MTHIDAASWMRAINDDREFGRQALFWDARVRVTIGDDAWLLDVRDGQVRSVVTPQLFDSVDLDITCPPAAMDEFLAEVPRAGYHDLYALVLGHGATWAGDIEMWFAYYGAIRRMFELLRPAPSGLGSSPVAVAAGER
jgi:hypothetical protein